MMRPEPVASPRAPVWTREALLRAVSSPLAPAVAHALARTREALDAVRPEKRVRKRAPDGTRYVEVTEGGAPDWPVRLRAAEIIYDLAGLRRRGAEDEGPVPVAAVTIALDVGGRDGCRAAMVPMRYRHLKIASRPAAHPPLEPSQAVPDAVASAIGGGAVPG